MGLKRLVALLLVLVVIGSGVAVAANAGKKPVIAIKPYSKANNR